MNQHITQEQADTKEKMAVGAFLSAMHDQGLDGAEVRKAMLELLGLAQKASAPAAVSGWKLVPVEPTPAMLAAVVTSMDDFLLGKEAEKQYREDWAAMLAAAPTAQAEGWSEGDSND